MAASPVRGLLVLLVTLVLAPLLIEGATSLLTGTPLSQRLFSSSDPYDVPIVPRGEISGLTEGPFARDRDPAIGFRLKSDASLVFAGVESTTDEFGQRVRAGGAPEDGALRIVVLGDSVAYGYGVADDETYAHRLEGFLADAMPAGEPRPVVFTVACPGWNWQGAFRYLRNHIDRLDPDVVLYVAVANDLEDSGAIDEVGIRTMDVDSVPGRPQVSTERHIRLRRTLERHPRPALAAEVMAAGGPRLIEMVVQTGVTPESDRRWRAYVDGIGAMADELSARDARFAVVSAFDLDYARQLEARLALARPDITHFGLMSDYTAADSLPEDSHYRAAVLREGSRRIARDLIAAGWAAGASADAVPEAPEEFADRDYVPIPDGEHATFLEELHAEFLAFVRDTVEFDDVQGVHQVYGGLFGDGMIGKHGYLALSNPDADQLALTLDRLPADRAVYPLELTITLRADGEPHVLALDVPAPTDDETRMTTTLDLPDALRGERVIDVLIAASRWVEVMGPKSWLEPRLESVRLRRAALVAR